MRIELSKCSLLTLSLILAACAIAHPVQAVPPATEVKLLVPAYFYPAGAGLKNWSKLISAAGKVPVMAIANPASGPGTAVDPAYASVIKLAQAGKVTVIGYVSTSYGKRTAAEIKTDIDNWISFYPTIQGIFFDEQASDAAQSDFYLDLAGHARLKIARAFIVTNPGTACAEEYFSKKVADTICIVEKGEGLDKYAIRQAESRFRTR